MRIPGAELHNRHLATYGAGAVELEPGVDEPGCPRLYRKRYVEKQVPELRSMELSYGSAVHEALYRMEEETIPAQQALRESWDAGLGEERFHEALTDLRDMIDRGGALTMVHTVAVEQHLHMPLYEDEDFGPIRFGGILDLIGVDSTLSEPVPNLLVVDYKSDRSPWSYADARAWRQGKGYGLLLRHNAAKYMPGIEHVNIIAIVEALKWYALPVEYSDEMLDEYQEWLISIARTILRDDKGAAKLNRACHYCSVKDDCPAWRQLPGQGTTVLERLKTVDLATRVGMMTKAKDIVSKLNSQIKEIDAALRDRVDADGSFVVGDVEWFFDDVETTDIDVRLVQKVLGDQMWEIASVTKGKIEDLMKEKPELYADLSRCLRKVPGGRKLKTRPVTE